MARPRCCRSIAHLPHCVLFKPAGIPMTALDEISLSLDELEALRLADFDGLYQEDAAGRMNVSRATFGRTLESAHRKVAQALIEGKALRIEGGEVEMSEVRLFACADCGCQWGVPFAGGRPAECPSCQGANFQCSSTGCAMGGRGGQDRNWRCRRGTGAGNPT
jgi:predicted DNA-binding protein (UPF0251 family)